MALNYVKKSEINYDTYATINKNNNQMNIKKLKRKKKQHNKKMHKGRYRISSKMLCNQILC